MKHIKLVATDLDGTFLKNDRSVSVRNLEALKHLGEQGVIRVAATGRNLLKVSEVIGNDVPFDYIVYSSGAGIFNWMTKKHMFQQNIDPAEASMLADYLRNNGYNFSVFAPAPDNHKLWSHRGESECEEFNRFCSFHQSWYVMPATLNFDDGLCQLVLIIPENDEHFSSLKQKIEMLSDQIRIIRSSSPVTKGFIWVEIFHHKVSKGQGVKYVCEQLGISAEETAGVGNDYNDIDLLNFTARSFIAANAPEPVKRLYLQVPSNEEDAFFHAVQPMLI